MSSLAVVEARAPQCVQFVGCIALQEVLGRQVMGRHASEFARNRFLMTRYLQDYLGIMIQTVHGPAW